MEVSWREKPVEWENQLAKIVVYYSLAIQAGEVVLLRGPLAAQSLLLALMQVVIETGAHALLEIEHPGAQYILYKYGSHEQITWSSPLQDTLVEHVNAEIRVYAPMLSQRTLMTLSESQRLLLGRNRTSNDALLLRERRFQTRECRCCHVLYPTSVFANDLGITLTELTQILQQGFLLPSKDPIAAWQEQAEEAKTWQEWLKNREQVQIRADGTDLCCSIVNRSFVAQVGQSLLPGGQLFTTPHTSSWQGVITFNTHGLSGGQHFSNVRMRFEQGEVVEIDAAEGLDIVRAMVCVDPGARLVGEFGFGLNPHMTTLIGSVPFDELIRGTMHLAFGKSYPGSGGMNTSRIHFDLIADLRTDGEIVVDGIPILHNGKLSLPS